MYLVIPFKIASRVDNKYRDLSLSTFPLKHSNPSIYLSNDVFRRDETRIVNTRGKETASSVAIRVSVNNGSRSLGEVRNRKRSWFRACSDDASLIEKVWRPWIEETARWKGSPLLSIARTPLALDLLTNYVRGGEGRQIPQKSNCFNWNFHRIFRHLYRKFVHIRN